LNNVYCPFDLSRAPRCLVCRHAISFIGWEISFRSTTSDRVKLIEHLSIAHQVGSMTFGGGSRTSEEYNRVSDLSKPQSFGTPMARTHSCIAHSHDWNEKKMLHVARGPTADGPALTEELSEFVRKYESQIAKGDNLTETVAQLSPSISPDGVRCGFSKRG
jgi:hypothetical protein